ncbi:MAG: hypothetical protein KJ983_02155, partial [Candidatus Omnitrophica bacterium]|nr:hypothetical protein [Candidatus Omnitrophota bacterium]
IPAKAGIHNPKIETTTPSLFRRAFNWLISVPAPMAAEWEIELVPLTGWRAEDYQDSRGITDVHEADGILYLDMNLEGKHHNKSKGEIYFDFPVIKNLSEGKIVLKLRAPPGFVLNKKNGVEIYLKDINWNVQYDDRTIITQSGEWITIEYMPTTRDEDPQNLTDPGFDPSNLRRIGVKFAINSSTSDTFKGLVEVKDVQIVPVTKQIVTTKSVNVYRDKAKEVTSVSEQKFAEKSGASFYLWLYEKTIGVSGTGVSVYYDRILEKFKRMSVDVARVWLTIGSKNTSGIKYAADGMPIRFKDFEQAVEDLVNLIKIGKETETRLILVLHNYDLAEAHKDVLEDPEKAKKLIELDRQLLTAAKAKLGADWDKYVSAIEVMNEPDQSEASTGSVQGFVKAGNTVIRSLDKPVSMAAGELGKAGFLISMLEDGDIFQIHWYYDFHEKPTGKAMFSELRKNVGRFNLPDGVKVKVVVGEAQPNIGDRSIIREVMAATRESGAEEVWMWFDDKANPEYKIDFEDYKKAREEMSAGKEKKLAPAPAVKKTPAPTASHVPTPSVAPQKLKPLQMGKVPAKPVITPGKATGPPPVKKITPAPRVPLPTPAFTHVPVPDLTKITQDIGKIAETLFGKANVEKLKKNLPARYTTFLIELRRLGDRQSDVVGKLQKNLKETPDTQFGQNTARALRTALLLNDLNKALSEYIKDPNQTTETVFLSAMNPFRLHDITPV